MSHHQRRNLRALGTLGAVASLLAFAGLGIQCGPDGEPGSATPPEPAATPRSVPHPAAAPPPVAAPTAAAKKREEGVVVLRAPWGSKLGEVGRRGGRESSPEGPMTFDVDARGEAFVLDQVNQRLQVFAGGAAKRSVPLPSDTVQDMALGDDGRVALLDRFGDVAVTTLDAAGNVASKVELVGPGVPDGGSVTGLFQRDDGTWVEVEHQSLVRVALHDGQPDADRATVAGRFTADGGALLRAARTGGYGVTISRQLAGEAPARFASAELDLPVVFISALEPDPRGRLWLGVTLIDDDGRSPFQVNASADVLLVFDQAGAELRRFVMPASAMPEETFRPIRVGLDGAVYKLELTPLGVVLRRYAL